MSDEALFGEFKQYLLTEICDWSILPESNSKEDIYLNANEKWFYKLLLDYCENCKDVSVFDCLHGFRSWATNMYYLAPTQSAKDLWISIINSTDEVYEMILGWCFENMEG